MYKTPELSHVGNIGEVVLGGHDVGTDNVSDPVQLPTEGAVLGLDD